jgi:hypothetical protein
LLLEWIVNTFSENGRNASDIYGMLWEVYGEGAVNRTPPGQEDMGLL